MEKKDQIENCFDVIAEVANTLCQAFVGDGDIMNLYLGQISTPLQLALFKPFCFETAVLMVALLGDRHPTVKKNLLEQTQLDAQEIGILEESCVQERLDYYSRNNDQLVCYSSLCLDMGISIANKYDLSSEDRNKRLQSNVTWKVALYDAIEQIKQTEENL